jgi:arginase
MNDAFDGGSGGIGGRRNDGTKPLDRSTRRPIGIVGVPLGLGGPSRETGGGPAALRSAGLRRRLEGDGHRVEDQGDVPVRAADRWNGRDPGPDVAAAIGEACVLLRDRVRSMLASGSIPLVLGGDHSLSVGSQAGVAAAHRALGFEAPGLIWFDAHADINTMATTASGNLHGMPVAALVGLPVPAFLNAIGTDGTRDPSRVVMVAQRDIDPGETAHLERLGVRVFCGQEIRRRGIDVVMTEAVLRAAGRDGRFSLSVDLDAFDPSIAPGVDCPVPEGVSLDEARLACSIVADHGGMVALDVVELNPSKDQGGRTAMLGIEIASSLFARRTPIALGDIIGTASRR